MPWVAAVATVAGAAISSDAQQSAAEDAANSQSQSAERGIAEQRRQFDAVQKLLSPFVTTGTNALTGQADLAGLNGASAQQAAISALQTSPQFTSLLKQGENAILQNASATGGLRGGNTQAALAQFRPQLLAQTIENQYGRLGGMASLGQNAAAGVGNAGMATGAGVSALLQRQGAAQAGAALAGGRADAGMINGIAQGFGMYGSYMNRGQNSAPSSGWSMGNAGYGDYKNYYDNGGQGV